MRCVPSRSLVYPSLAAAATLLGGCFVDRSGIVGDAAVDAGAIERDAGDCTATGAEICDGADNDCNGAIDDGLPAAACDSDDDDDACADDSEICANGAIACEDDGDPSDELEICDGEDNDCDGDLADDGEDDPSVAADCDGGDADLCAEGSFDCTDGILICDDETSDTLEGTCDGEDDDCDGRVDDGADCPCEQFVSDDGHSYLFCQGSGGGDSWNSARGSCEGLGYTLVRIESREEQLYLAMRAPNDDDYWIGATDHADYSTEGVWVWYADDPRAPIEYENWRDGEPNDFDGSEHCAELSPPMLGVGDPSDPMETLGGWNDDDCGSDGRYICEASP